VRHRDGGWRLLVLPETWSDALWMEVLSGLEGAQPARHPLTRRLRFPAGAGGRDYFLKLYFPSSGFAGGIKDLLRDSKAIRALKQGDALRRNGFDAPPAIAAGEERSCGLLRRAFLLTAGLEAQPIAALLREQFTPPPDRAALAKKRAWLRKLAFQVRRLHELGFVHGDLVPSNILACRPREEVAFFYMDNDRTRRYPNWMPQRLWRRNLVQLNRFVLPGISLQDRMRFLRSYLGEKPWTESERRLVHWLERKTRLRRKEYERIEAQVSFRELMRWNGPFAKNS
jgi:hypothetical protein